MNESEFRMPTFRKMSSDEVQKLEWAKTGVRKAIAAQFDTHMQDFEAGDYGEITLSPGEKRLTVMSRLKAAANRRVPALKVVFRRTNDPNTLRFVVHANEAAAASPPARQELTPIVAEQSQSSSAPKKRSRSAANAAPETPPKRRPGRPRKNATA